MGTSSRMSPSIKGQPNWGKLSDNVTRACDGNNTPEIKLRNIISQFVKAAGGSNKIGRGNSQSLGKAGVSSSRKIAGFFGSVYSQGFEEALRETGLESLEGKSVQDVINHLIDYCAENANTIDDVAARAATSYLLHELIDTEKEFEDLENDIKIRLDKDGLNDIMILFFAQYIYEHLSTRFEENLKQAKSPQHCNKLFKEIRDWIFESIKDTSTKTDLALVDLAGAQGERIIKNIFEDILKIYE